MDDKAQRVVEFSVHNPAALTGLQKHHRTPSRLVEVHPCSTQVRAGFGARRKQGCSRQRFRSSENYASVRLSARACLHATVHWLMHLCGYDIYRPREVWYNRLPFRYNRDKRYASDDGGTIYFNGSRIAYYMMLLHISH